jgi:hypothetical protein
MKLDAGNPNLMKKKAMRVNLHASLQNFAQTIGDKESARYRTGFVPLEKKPHTALPPSINVWEQPVYKPDNSGYVRPGADDHLKIKSRGM